MPVCWVERREGTLRDVQATGAYSQRRLSLLLGFVRRSRDASDSSLRSCSSVWAGDVSSALINNDLLDSAHGTKRTQLFPLAHEVPPQRQFADAHPEYRFSRPMQKASSARQHART